MPIEIMDLDDGVGNIITGSGYISEEEFLDVLKVHLTQEDEKFKKYRYSFLDWTEATKVDISSNGINTIAKFCIESSIVNPEVVIAQVANKDLLFGFARMWEILSDRTNWEIMVFRDKKEAKIWIQQKVKDKYNIIVNL